MTLTGFLTFLSGSLEYRILSARIKKILSAVNFVLIAISNNWSTEEENKLSFLVCVWKNLSEKFQAIKISYCLMSYCGSDVTNILNIWIFQSFLDSKVWSKWECWVEAVMDEPWKLADSALLTWMITGWREVRVRNFSKTVSSSGVLWKQNILFCEMKKRQKASIWNFEIQPNWPFWSPGCSRWALWDGLKHNNG